MSTAPLLLSDVGVPGTKGAQLGTATRYAGTRSQDARSRRVQASCRLTDRGIAVVIAMAIALMTTALLVIGLTAARVTSVGYDLNVQGSHQVRQ
jgi:hypothetical protein